MSGEQDMDRDEAITRLNREERYYKLLEKLAELEHEQWVEWSKIISREVSRSTIRRWEKYWIPYEKLPENVKEQDRVYAKKIIKLLKKERL